MLEGGVREKEFSGLWKPVFPLRGRRTLCPGPHPWATSHDPWPQHP